MKTSEEQTGDGDIASMNWLGRRVICPFAPKYARRGCKGTGWIGEVYWDKGDKVRVAFKGTKALKWFHKSNLTLLKP